VTEISQKLARLARIPARCRRDARLIGLLENWRDALAAEWHRTPLERVRLRNGVVLASPATVSLAFLFHETWVRKVYSPPGYRIGAGDTVIDIGANIGVFAAYAATRAAGVRVFAYEPFPENIAWLKRNVTESRLTNVEVRAQAVGAETCVRTLQVDPGDWIMHSLFARPDGTDAQALAVECVSFDEVMNQPGVARCDLLKLDCEGSEYEILQGCAPDTLRRVRRIVGEFHEGEHIAGTARELCRYLEARAFRIDRFVREGAGSGLFCATNTAA
jgi:FkbM family methyltransferase